MAKRRWLVPLVVLAAAALYYYRRSAATPEIAVNLRAYGMPSARLYDVLPGALFGGFYDRVAGEVALACPSGTVLEIGPGPGHLAVRLAELTPNLRITGVDVAPDMVERAARRAAEAGVAGRVGFEVGDVAALPFPDAQFDLVVSTFSLHHWQDPALGLAEIHRVLKPGGRAYIYDVADWLLRLTHHGTGLAGLATTSPFGAGAVSDLRWPGSLPLVRRLELARA